MINNCIRWPLIIDPQSQANLWIKKWQKGNNLQVAKLDNPQFMNHLENCIKLGFSFLIENVEEWLDPVLDPILQRDVFKRGF
jgi:dynein heavy chain, axonemal